MQNNPKYPIFGYFSDRKVLVHTDFRRDLLRTLENLKKNSIFGKDRRTFIQFGEAVKVSVVVTTVRQLELGMRSLLKTSGGRCSPLAATSPRSPR